MLAPTIACTHLAERGVREGEVEGEAEGLKLEEVWLENGDSPGTVSSSLREGGGGGGGGGGGRGGEGRGG